MLKNPALKKYSPLLIYWFLTIIALYSLNVFYVTEEVVNWTVVYLFTLIGIPVGIAAIAICVKYFYAKAYKTKGDNYKVNFNFIFYFLVFYIVPFLILGSGLVFSGMDWFFLYIKTIYPFSSLILLVSYKESYKNKIEFYKRKLFIVWFLFALSYVIIPIYIYIMVQSMLSLGKGFPF